VPHRVAAWVAVAAVAILAAGTTAVLVKDDDAHDRPVTAAGTAPPTPVPPLVTRPPATPSPSPRPAPTPTTTPSATHSATRPRTSATATVTTPPPTALPTPTPSEDQWMRSEHDGEPGWSGPFGGCSQTAVPAKWSGPPVSGVTLTMTPRDAKHHGGTGVVQHGPERRHVGVDERFRRTANRHCDE
jgi:hypothetical protein